MHCQNEYRYRYNQTHRVGFCVGFLVGRRVGFGEGFSVGTAVLGILEGCDDVVGAPVGVPVGSFETEGGYSKTIIIIPSLSSVKTRVNSHE